MIYHFISIILHFIFYMVYFNWVIYMKINGFETNKEVILEIGRRIQAKRISLSMTQKILASDAGISVRTLSALENGENISLDNLISVLRVLKLIQNIDGLLPQVKMNPFDVLQLGHQRQRVSTKKTINKSSNIWEDEL